MTTLVTDALLATSAATLEALALELDLGRLRHPYTALGLKSRLGPSAAALVPELNALHAQGLEPKGLATMLRVLARQRRALERERERVELVWTGPEARLEQSRDTLVVVRELFGQAQRSALIVGYAFYQGKTIFAELAKKLRDDPAFKVRICAHIKRDYNDQRTPDATLISRYVEDFITKQWPDGCPAPPIYYDPRTVEAGQHKRASMHAKCIVIDHQHALITSANFTEAAYERNIEAGVLLHDPHMSVALERQFDHLIHAGILRLAHR